MWPFRKKQNVDQPVEQRTDAEQRSDGWNSALSGFGMAQHDKRVGVTFSSDIIDWHTAMELWRGDDLATRIIETPPNEMLREGFELRVDDDDSKSVSENIGDWWEGLNTIDRLWEGLTYERAYGGSGILMGVNDGRDMSEPLNLDTVRALDWLTTLEPRELSPIQYYTDPRTPKFGQPSMYRLTAISPGVGELGSVKNALPPVVDIHESRFVIFPGIRVSRQQYTGALGGWGDSVLTRVWRVLRDFNMSWASAAVLLHDFAQAVFKMKGLAEAMALDKDQLIKNRIKAVEMSRSAIRAILMDAEEEFERKQTPVSGMPELLDRFMYRMAAAADQPVTLLMGMSPAGMNATGASDLRFFYDRMAAGQRKKVKPAVRTITQILLRAKTRVPKRWTIFFNPLWQPNELESAQARHTQAQTDTLYIQNGVISPEEIAVSRFAGDDYSFATSLAEPEDLNEETVEGMPTPGGDVQRTAFNGTQIASMVAIVTAVNQGQLSRESAIAMLQTSFPSITTEQADAIVGPKLALPPAPDPHAPEDDETEDGEFE
jgi:phage-related protein (TIGR01555 family)